MLGREKGCGRYGGKYHTVSNDLKCRGLADGDDGLIQAPTGGARWKHSQIGTSEVRMLVPRE